MKIRGQSHGHKARPPGEVIKLPIGTPFVVANEATTDALPRGGACAHSGVTFCSAPLIGDLVAAKFFRHVARINWTTPAKAIAGSKGKNVAAIDKAD